MIGRFGRIAVTLAAIAALAWTLDARAVGAALATAAPGWLALGVALTVPQMALSAWRWRLAVGVLGGQLRPGRALTEYDLATLLNQLLPTGVAGDAARAWRQRGHSARRAAKAVLIERGAGQVALAVAVLVGAEGALRLVAAVVIVAAFALAHRAGVRARDGAVQLGLSALILGTYLAGYACALIAVGAPIDARVPFVYVPLVLWAMALPVSMGGWGLREGAAATLAATFGLDPTAAVAASVLYGIANLAGSAPGLAVLLDDRHRAVCSR